MFRLNRADIYNLYCDIFELTDFIYSYITFIIIITIIMMIIIIDNINHQLSQWALYYFISTLKYILFS
jgi:hypothetical protein